LGRAANPARLPFTYSFPVIEHEDPVRDTHHESHVVVDKEDRRSVVTDPADQLHERVFLRGVHSGRRFVQQKQLRTRGQSSSDLEAPLVAVREIASKISGVTIDPNEPKEIVRLVLCLLLLTALRRRVEE
jgi:hypothetical protein